MFDCLHEIKQAEVVLFPEYWQVNSLVYALKKKIFPSIAAYHLGHDKVEMTRSFQALCPEHVLKTGIHRLENTGFDELADRFGMPFVCKEIHSSSGLGVFLIKSREDFNYYAKTNPTIYVQEYIPLERDLRIVVIGDRVVSAYWRVGGMDSFHNNISRGGKICRESVPKDIVDKVLTIAQGLGINYAGFDVALTDWGMFLLEFNLYFGTQGIPMNSFEIGQIIQHYLASESVEANLETTLIPDGCQILSFGCRQLKERMGAQ
ncbi:MAG: ATP-grasp domain-containing protein [Desulfobacter sp.]|nr:MAG: ATP-grasp domain-containing protein [Desulfobacter sp.]